MNQQSHIDHLGSDTDKQDLHIKGPAISFICKGGDGDNVFSLYSPKWPTEAKDWFYRTRNYGWPTKANLRKIVNMGCHVVYAQHRDCRDDEDQWRLSFSLAEVVLLRSWTKTQQLVYHLLRFFAKEELIQKECPKEKEVLCTYHLKTLILWTCEQESPEWWNSSVIGLCSKLLRKLSEWLQRRLCPNYFIPEANLFHEPFDLDIYQAIAECIQNLSNRENLSQWFLYNYLLPFCTKVGWMANKAYDHSIPELCNIARTITLNNKFKIIRSLDANFYSLTIENAFHLNEARILQELDWKQNSHVAGRLPVTSEKSKIVVSLIYMLRAANIIICKRVSCFKTFLSNVMAILIRRFSSDWPKYNNFPNNYEIRCDEIYVNFLRAQEYMGEMPASVSDPEFQLLTRLSMEFLRKSVSCTDATCEDIRCAAFAYMAAICFANSQYETAIELCSVILTNSEPLGSNRLSSSKRVPLSAGCLTFIDDVSKIIGYLLLWKHVLDTLLDRYSEINLDLRLAPEIFAQYIMIQSMQRMSQQLYLKWRKIPEEFLMDALLIAVMKIQLKDISIKASGRMRGYSLCVYRRSRSVSELMSRVIGFSLDEDISIRLLMECSLKNITSICEDAFEHCCFQLKTLAFCYRVVYHYRCHHYEEVIILCEQILCEPDIGADVMKYPFVNVMVLPPFSSFFDEEVQCLIGLQMLCLILFPSHPNGLCVHVIQNYCSVFCNLSKCFNFRCRYLLRRHFLARYLQLRCLIDSRSSMSEILRAFGKLKCLLHFECIVHRFLWQKLRKTFKRSK